MEPTQSVSAWMQLIPLLLMSIPIGIGVHKLAKEKGRRIAVWTTLGFIPFVNFIFLWYAVGAADLTLRAQVARLLAAVEREGER